MTQGKTWKSLNTFDYQALVFGWIFSIGVIDVQGSGAVSAVETARVLYNKFQSFQVL
jgi:hypothetical protein